MSVGRKKEFSAVDAIGSEKEPGRQLSGSSTGPQWETCQQSEEGGSIGASSKGGSTSPPRSSVAERKVVVSSQCAHRLVYLKLVTNNMFTLID